MKTVKLFALLLGIFCITHLSAQKKVVLEKLRCYSSTGPVMNYFRDASIRQTIASQLNQVLEKFHNLQLSDTITLANIEYLSAPDKAEKITQFTVTDTSVLHLYLDIFEIEPLSYFFVPARFPLDSSLRARARSIFLLEASIVRPDKTLLFSERIHAAISTAASNGMGLLYRYITPQGVLRQVVATPKGFTEVLKAANRLLFDPKSTMALVEMRVAPAFFGTDFIPGLVSNRQRIFVSNTKNISRYTYRDTLEMTRMGDAVYEDVITRGKKAKKYPADLTNALAIARDKGSNDFVFLRQDCRDVIRDKTYSLQLVSQVRVNAPSAASAFRMDFLPGSFNCLLRDNDTIAKFSIRTRLEEAAKKIFFHKISNGVDTGSVFTLSGKANEQSMQYGFLVNGRIGAQEFTIKCGGINETTGYPLKEIYLADKLVCIAQGEFYPEKFVVFDASLSNEILNQLLMIGFNRFFQ